MEQNLPVLVKKVLRLVRVVYFMLKKCISKRKILLDLNMMIKRGVIAGKALQKLMFKFNHHNNRHSFPSPPSTEYEFSCTTSPFVGNYPLGDFDIMAADVAMLRDVDIIHSLTASPVLPGFGRGPVVRQLRVTDSPFPLGGVDGDNHVDEAAEQFISRFYNDMRRQNTKAAIGSF